MSYLSGVFVLTWCEFSIKKIIINDGDLASLGIEPETFDDVITLELSVTDVAIVTRVGIRRFNLFEKENFNPHYRTFSRKTRARP